MKKSLILSLILLGTIIFVSGSAYATPFVWGQDIMWERGAGVSDQRANVLNALDSPDAPALGGVDFLSLGIGGYAVFDFGVEFNEASVIFETTYGNTASWVEGVEVYAVSDDDYTFNNDPGADFDGWELIGSFSNSNSEINLTINGPFRYLGLLDVTQDYAIVGSSSYKGDGFDVNAVGVAPVPEPATMLLFGTGLAGLAGVRFRRKKK